VLRLVLLNRSLLFAPFHCCVDVPTTDLPLPSPLLPQAVNSDPFHIPGRVALSDALERVGRVSAAASVSRCTLRYLSAVQRLHSPAATAVTPWLHATVAALWRQCDRACEPPQPTLPLSCGVEDMKTATGAAMVRGWQTTSVFPLRC
jgi:hypothetical protein